MYHDTSFMIYITKLYRVAWALIYIGILQTTHRGGGGGGAVGEGVRLWLFIYCYIDIKLTQ